MLDGEFLESVSQTRSRYKHYKPHFLKNLNFCLICMMYDLKNFFNKISEPILFGLAKIIFNLFLHISFILEGDYGVTICTQYIAFVDFV